MLIMANQSVILGMSGGVDSSVAALILQKQGFQVTGVFMKNWEEDDDTTTNFCNATQDLNDAQQVCNKLNIPLLKVNFAAEYWDKVFSIFLQEYQAGRTPNPDILCNKEIKFKVFLDYAKQLKADFIATGHYARINKQHNNVHLLTAFDQNKDQSYFLHALTKEQLSNCLFPIGELNKQEVRKMASQAGLDNYNKKDSTGICFIGERKFKNFLEKYLPHQPGKIITETGEVIGTHDGLMYYTIGQRKGLQIGGQASYHGMHKPWYVVDKNINNNQLIVARGKNHPTLFAKQLHAINFHWIDPDQIITTDPFYCYAKIRYRQTSQACSIQIINKNSNELLVIFENAQRAISPGQYIVFYKENYCLGGAIIERSI